MVVDRYQNEVRRLFGVLDGQLERQPWLADDYSIADIANWAWVHTHDWSGVAIDAFPALADWVARMASRDACRRGVVVPHPFDTRSIVRQVQAFLGR